MQARTASALAVTALAAVSCGGEESGNGPRTPPGAPGTEGNPAPAAVADGAWFRDVTEEVGLTFEHVAGPTEARYVTQIVGSGAAVFDYDGDGDQDVYLIQAGTDPARGASREGAPNELFANDGSLGLTRVAGSAGLVGRAYGLGVGIGDLDNDGRPDVYLTNYGPNQLYRNAGGTFEDTTIESGALVGGFSCSCAFLDYDRDGFLDLYVVQYVQHQPSKRCFDPADRRDYCGPTTFPPASDFLLHNRGDGTLEDVSEEAGMAAVAAAGLGIVSRDFDEDGWPDVYVANDTYENHLWINRTDGTFVDDAVVLGVAYNLHGQHEAGMGVIAEDLDGDGLVDLFMTHLARETNTLYRNMGAGTGFTDVTGQTGLGVSSKVYTGFGTAALDVELDGDLDLLVANGRVTRAEVEPPFDVPPPWNLYAEPNLFYRNAGDGRFEPAAALAPGFCAPKEVSRAIAVGDLDDDGDPDVVLTNIAGRARLFRNDAPRAGSWLRLVVDDPALERHAIGAVVTLELGGRTWVRTVSRACGYLTSNDPRLLVGIPEELAGSAALSDARLRVRWPDGGLEEFRVPGLDRELVLRRGEGRDLE